MKIVHVVPILLKGGGERVVVELANYAAQSGHTVTVVAAFPVDPSLLQDMLHNSVTVKFVSEKGGNKYLFILPWLIKNRSWMLKQDVLHCHLTYGSLFGTLTKFLRKISKCKQLLIVETYHAVGMAIPKLNRLIHAHLASGRDAVALMAQDDFWKKFIVRHPRQLIQIIPNGVSVPEKSNAANPALIEYKKELGIPNSCNLIVGTIGMLRTDRQPWRYIPIFAAVAEKMGPDVHFVIAGSGIEEARIVELIAKHKLEDCVHMPGLLKDTSPAFSIFDVYISLSVGATTGVSMLEAALHKLPVVAIQMIDNYKASSKDWVWSSTSDDEIVNRIIELLQSKESRETLANQQYAYVQSHYTTKAMSDAYFDLYKQGRENILNTGAAVYKN